MEIKALLVLTSLKAILNLKPTQLNPFTTLVAVNCTIFDLFLGLTLKKKHVYIKRQINSNGDVDQPSNYAVNFNL